MNQEPISPDDPRLTLYALGEMEPREQAGFEKLLEQDPVARQTIAEIRAMAETVTAALEQEPAEVAAKPALGKVLRFPQAYFMISGLAAACFAVFFVLWQNERELHQESHLIEVPLAQAKVAKDDKAVAADGAVTLALPPAPVAEKQPMVTLTLDQPGPIQVAPPLQDIYRGNNTEMRAEVSTLPADPLTEARRNQVAEVAADNERKKQEARQVAMAGLQKSAQETAMSGAAASSPSVNAPAPAAVAVAQSPAALAGGKDEAVMLTPFTVASSSTKAKVAAKGGVTLAREMKDNGYAFASRDKNANTEAYASTKDNPFLRVADQPRSTFSIDVGTASYADVRRFLSQHQRPSASAVRIEELVNYFPYDYAPPVGNVPFAASLEVASAPWQPEHRLVRIGLKGRETGDAQRPAGGTLVTIAKDVKIQVEFNPAQVQAYRLIGYDENRLPAKEDFNNDKVAASEIGAGHTVTALYEVVPVGAVAPADTSAVDGLKYQTVKTADAKPQTTDSQELLTVTIRYKEPAGDVSSKLEFPLVDKGTAFADASSDFKFAAAVAGFGMTLRDSPYKGQLTLANVAEWGRAGLGQDVGGYRSEFLSLVNTADLLLR